jgi:hypothetical protein
MGNGLTRNFKGRERREGRLSLKKGGVENFWLVKD